jgi:hypothetical protein
VISPRNGSAPPFSQPARNTHTCSHPIRPKLVVAYEHMFPPSETSKLAQRALGALRIGRSFLLLEDDHDVDWEVGQDEYWPVAHPHRAPLRRGSVERRAGQVPARPQPCLSPVERASNGGHEARLRASDPGTDRRVGVHPVTPDC